jgi:hypothetical protein
LLFQINIQGGILQDCGYQLPVKNDIDQVKLEKGDEDVDIEDVDFGESFIADEGSFKKEVIISSPDVDMLANIDCEEPDPDDDDHFAQESDHEATFFDNDFSDSESLPLEKPKIIKPKLLNKSAKPSALSTESSLVGGKRKCLDKDCDFSHDSEKVIRSHIASAHSKVTFWLSIFQFSDFEYLRDKIYRITFSTLSGFPITCLIKPRNVIFSGNTERLNTELLLVLDMVESNITEPLSCSLQVTCSHCDKKFGPTYIVKHIKSKHSPTKKKECQECKMSFGSKLDLALHLEKVHSIGIDPVYCDSCGNFCAGERLYQRHRKNCKPGARRRVPYACKLDPKKPTCCPQEGCDFESQNKLKIMKHYRVKHERQICPYCGLEYTYYGMKEHIAKEHTKDLDYQCHECKEKFFNEAYLREHQEREHIRKLLYVCENCGKRFHSKKLVARHKYEIHSRCKHNPCSMCSIVYRNRRSLVKHMKTVHNVKLPPLA